MSNRGIRAGAVVDGTDWKMPARVTGYGAGANSISASSFSVLPSFTASCSITNPHPFATLLVYAEYGAWLKGNGSTGDVRMCLSVSGGIIVTPGIGGGGPVGWGEVLLATSTSYQQHRAACTYEIPAGVGSVTFSVYAYRNGTGTTACDFPVVRVTPLRYLYDQGRTA